jgi:hypothetical protein
MKRTQEVGSEEQNWRKSWQNLVKKPQTKSFAEKLSDEAIEYFNSVCKKPFSEQAVAFLNAYWPEIGDEAEFIFSVAWEQIRRAEMHNQGIQLIHKYNEGCELEFDTGLYFYEKLCKFLEDNPDFVSKYPKSQPEMMTALKRKAELREKVDVNFDGKISFLEYLLYQYQNWADPADFVRRSMNNAEEHPEIRKARLALEDVNKRIREYEAERYRLEQEAQLDGVKGLKAKNLLAQLDSSPLAEELNRALITAEAAVRIATKKFGGQNAKQYDASGGEIATSTGAIWWMNRDLEEKKKKYGKK